MTILEQHGHLNSLYCGAYFRMCWSALRIFVRFSLKSDIYSIESLIWRSQPEPTCMPWGAHHRVGEEGRHKVFPSLLETILIHQAIPTIHEIPWRFLTLTCRPGIYFTDTLTWGATGSSLCIGRSFRQWKNGKQREDNSDDMTQWLFWGTTSYSRSVNDRMVSFFGSSLIEPESSTVKISARFQHQMRTLWSWTCNLFWALLSVYGVSLIWNVPPTLVTSFTTVAFLSPYGSTSVTTPGRSILRLGGKRQKPW